MRKLSNFEAQPILTESMEIEPPSNPSTGKLTSSPSLSCKVVVKLRSLRLVYAQLHNGNVGLGEDVSEYRPRTVIESPATIKPDRNRCEQIPDTGCKFRPAGRGILHFI
jgi:hypothetical protein